MIRVTSGIGALAIVCLAASAVAFQPAEREPSGPPGTGWQLVFDNSFWLMSNTPRSKPGRFEIDINEGHYPYGVNMNLHQHSGQHWAKGGRWYYYGAAPHYTQDDAGWSGVLEQPVTTSKLRLVSNDADIVRIMEWRVFPPSADGYPSVFPNHRQTEARRYHDILCEQFENPEMILQNAGTWTEDRVRVGD